MRGFVMKKKEMDAVMDLVVSNLMDAMRNSCVGHLKYYENFYEIDVLSLTAMTAVSLLIGEISIASGFPEEKSQKVIKDSISKVYKFYRDLDEKGELN
jgi:hypothetical protein